jgi:hypothetical protein
MLPQLNKCANIWYQLTTFYTKNHIKVTLFILHVHSSNGRPSAHEICYGISNELWLSSEYYSIKSNNRFWWEYMKQGIKFNNKMVNMIQGKCSLSQYPHTWTALTFTAHILQRVPISVLRQTPLSNREK